MDGNTVYYFPLLSNRSVYTGAMSLSSYWADCYTNWFLFGRFKSVNCCFYGVKDDQANQLTFFYTIHQYDQLIKLKLEKDYKIMDVLTYISRGELCVFQIQSKDEQHIGGINKLKDAINNIILENQIPIELSSALTFDSSTILSKQNVSDSLKSKDYQSTKPNSVIYLSFLRAISRTLALKLVDAHTLYESASQLVTLNVLPFSSNLLVSNTIQKKKPTQFISYSLLRLNPVISQKNEILINIHSTKPLFYKLEDFIVTTELNFKIYVIPSAMKYKLAESTIEESIVKDTNEIENTDTLFQVLKDLINFNPPNKEFIQWIRLISPINKKEVIWPIQLCMIQFTNDFKPPNQDDHVGPLHNLSVGDDIYQTINEFINFSLDDGEPEPLLSNDNIISEEIESMISDKEMNPVVKASLENINDNQNDNEPDNEWDDLFGSESPSNEQLTFDNIEKETTNNNNNNNDDDINDDDLDQQLDELFNTPEMINLDQFSNIENTTQNPDSFNDNTFQYKNAYSSPLYNDPGAPSPQEFQIFAPTPESVNLSDSNSQLIPFQRNNTQLTPNAQAKRKSIFSPLVFNPVIERDIDSKYSDGGKFHVKLSSTNDPDTSLNNIGLFNLKNGNEDDDESESESEMDVEEDLPILDEEEDEENGELEINDEIDDDDDDIDDFEIEVDAIDKSSDLNHSQNDLLHINDLDEYEFDHGVPMIQSDIVLSEPNINDKPINIQLSQNWINILRPRMVFQGPYQYWDQRPKLTTEMIPILQELIWSCNMVSNFREGIKYIDSDLEFLLQKQFNGVRKLSFKEVFSEIQGDKLYETFFQSLKESAEEKDKEVDELNGSICDIVNVLNPALLKAKLQDNKDDIYINETSLYFWRILNLKPYFDKKNIKMIFIMPVIANAIYSYNNKGHEFQKNIGDCFHDINLGHIETIEVFEVELENYWENISNKFNELKWSSITAKDDVLIMVVNPECGSVSFNSLYQMSKICLKFRNCVESLGSSFYKLINLETFHSVQTDKLVTFSKRNYIDLCLHLYTLCPTNHSLKDRNPLFTICEENSINLTLNAYESPNNNDQYLHVCYERSADKKWVVASWTNHTGDINYTKSWFTESAAKSFSTISDEIMEISLKYANKFKDSKTYMILTRLNNIFPDDELSDWKRLSMNRRVCLIVITVDPEPSSLILTKNPGLNLISQSLSTSNKEASTPGTAILVSTSTNGNALQFPFNGPGSSVKFESPDLSMFTPSYDVVISPQDQMTHQNPGSQNTILTLPPVHEQADTPVLIDIDNTSIGIILPTSQVLSNQNVRIPLKTGYLIQGGESGCIENKVIEINLLSCYPTLSVTEILKEIMKQYKNLSILNRYWGIDNFSRDVGAVDFERVWNDDESEKMQYLQFRKQQQSQQSYNIQQLQQRRLSCPTTIIPYHVAIVRKLLDTLVNFDVVNEQ